MVVGHQSDVDVDRLPEQFDVLQVHRASILDQLRVIRFKEGALHLDNGHICTLDELTAGDPGFVLLVVQQIEDGVQR